MRNIANSRFGSSKNERLVLALLLIMQTAMLVWIDVRCAPGWDEWGHLPSGIYHVLYGDFQPYRVNPPLVRTIAVLPVIVNGGAIRQIPLPDDDSEWRSEFELGRLFLSTHGEKTFEYFSLARVVLIPGSWLGTVLLRTIGKRLYGNMSGWIAAILWTFSPLALTFGGTIAPDVWAATFGLLAIWRYYIWLTIRTWRALIWLGCATAFAMLCKSTWIILPPTFLVLFIADRLKHNRQNVKLDIIQIGFGSLLAMLIIHAGYDFRGSLRPLGDFKFYSQTLTGNKGTNFSAGNRFGDSWLRFVPAPLPSDYVQGIDIQRYDFQEGRESYFLGQWQDHGWWYYYLIGIPLKEPVAFFGFTLLFILGLVRKVQPRLRWREIVLLTPGFIVFVFVSSQIGFNHHLRYVLPFYPCLYLLAGRSVAGGGKWVHRIAVFLCFLYAISSASVLPRSYSFFSEAVGGPTNGWRYLGDSNLDWGQDLLALNAWHQQNPDKRPLWVIYTIPDLDFRRMGMDFNDGTEELFDGQPDSPGWWAIFAFRVIRPEYKWFLERPATIQLTPSVKLIHITSEDLARIREQRQQGELQ